MFCFLYSRFWMKYVFCAFTDETLIRNKSGVLLNELAFF